MDYEIAELKDMSSAAKRISAKIIADLDRNDKDAIESTILDLVKVVRRKKVEKERTLINHGSKPFDVVYINLYKNRDEVNHGIPLARASFIDPRCEVKPMHFSDDFIDENTTIRYDGFYEELNLMINDNKVSDEVFLNRLSHQLEELLGVYDSIKVYLDDFDLLAEECNKQEPILRNMEGDFIGFPNDDYMDIYDRHQSLLASLSNIGVVANNFKYSDIQKYHLIDLHFSDAQKDVEYLLSKMK